MVRVRFTVNIWVWIRVYEFIVRVEQTDRQDRSNENSEENRDIERSSAEEMAVRWAPSLAHR